MTVQAPRERAWFVYTDEAMIRMWNAASPDWHCPAAHNDVQTGGGFSFRMEAKDGSEGFDFAGTYVEVVPHERLSYRFGDRIATVVFTEPQDGGTRVTVTFDPETENSRELQVQGWQAILDNYKRVAESVPKLS